MFVSRHDAPRKAGGAHTGLSRLCRVVHAGRRRGCLSGLPLLGGSPDQRFSSVPRSPDLSGAGRLSDLDIARVMLPLPEYEGRVLGQLGVLASPASLSWQRCASFPGGPQRWSEQPKEVTGGLKGGCLMNTQRESLRSKSSGETWAVSRDSKELVNRNRDFPVGLERGVSNPNE